MWDTSSSVAAGRVAHALKQRCKGRATRSGRRRWRRTCGRHAPSRARPTRRMGRAARSSQRRDEERREDAPAWAPAPTFLPLREKERTLPMELEPVAIPLQWRWLYARARKERKSVAGDLPLPLQTPASCLWWLAAGHSWPAQASPAWRLAGGRWEAADGQAAAGCLGASAEMKIEMA